MSPIPRGLSRLTCSHKYKELMAIEFDGTAIYVCAWCGKYIHVPLGKGRKTDDSGRTE